MLSPAPCLVNTHIHLPPNFSAFDGVDDAVSQAESEALRVLGASNYYDFTVYRRFADAARQRGIAPLFGIEIMAMDASLARDGVLVNDPGNPGKTYLCGKGIALWENPPPAARKVLDRIRARDAARMAEMVGRLDRHFAEHGLETDLGTDGIIRDVAARSDAPVETVVLQERHVARAFQEAVFGKVDLPGRAERLEKVLGAPVEDPADPGVVQDAIRSRLMKAGRPAFVDEDYVSVEEAIALVRDLGGTPCYPVLADGASPVTAFEAEPARLAAALGEWGIGAAEFIPRRNAPDVLETYAAALQAAGFTLTAGTEHNTPERIPLAPACKGGAPLPDRVAEAFHRGAMEAVARQDSGE